MLPQVVLQEPDVTAQLIDAWLQICTSAASGVLGRKLVGPAMYVEDEVRLAGCIENTHVR